jgi:putative flavoprotein involved in K+ transport
MDRFDVIVIGAGQAGLGMGYQLKEAGFEFLIVDDRSRIGDNWRERWDSLELFTPRRYAQLPGFGLADTVPDYPNKTHIADYLEQYRNHFDLPVRGDFRVREVFFRDRGFTVSDASDSIAAATVVIAAGPFSTPNVPACASNLSPSVRQVHSAAYANPDSIGAGTVLVVGGGNSAAQIAEELAAAGRQVTIASNGAIAFAPKRILGVSLFRFMDLTGFLRADKDAWVSKYARPFSDTVIGFGLKKMIKAGKVRHVLHRVVDCVERDVVFADGTTESYDNVVWGTGFRPQYDWVQIEGALDDGAPLHECGVSPVPGLFWLGLPWQSRLNSALINGVARDTADLLRHIKAAVPAG